MKEMRPWGNFQVLLEEENLKVKLLEVLPGRRLSYQSHEHRSERWTIAEGEADITIDDRRSRYSTGQMIMIDRGQKHRVGNPSDSVLRIIEVQLGDKLEEGDITRYDDDYGRI